VTAPPTAADPFAFDCVAHDGRARAGRFRTPHGSVETPIFMPVGTLATVKSLDPDDLHAAGAQMLLANAYHLHLRPGDELVRDLGGLHPFMQWSSPLLTDSGGFQVFSLPERQSSEEGVRFRFAADSEPMMLSPETSMDIQRRLGADIVMAFDECVEPNAAREYVAASVERTHRWLKRCQTVALGEHQHLFGIIQGGMDLDLRSRCVSEVVACGLPGYAIGGVSVGEGHAAMVRIVRHTAPLMPADQVRYLMGVGLPEDIVASVDAGMDIHDCVIPTRYAREGTVFTWDGKMRLQDKKFRKDRYAIDTACTCAACAGGFSRAYLRHLIFAHEALGETLMTIHNLHFYQDLMRAIRAAIEAGRFVAWKQEFLARYAGGRPPRGEPDAD